jgi:elongator complex protein 3
MSTTNEKSTVLVIGEIVKELCRAYDKGETVKLQNIKQKVQKKYRMQSGPKLVEIIAAIPETHRTALLPMLKAKPVRTASGIAVVAVMCKPHRCPHIAMTGNICKDNNM